METENKRKKRIMRKMMLTGMVVAGAGMAMAAAAMAQVPVAAVASNTNGVPVARAVTSATVAAAPVSGTVKAPLTKAQALMISADDRVLGSMMAPVTVIEYASLSCSHCADFEKETFPQIKKEWIDTGKVKYVLRDLPWDDMALGMAKVTRCAPEAQFYPLVETFYAQQMKIFGSKDVLGEIKNVAKMAGMAPDQVEACIKDPDIHAKVVAMKDTGFNVLQVRGTPTFFVNGTVVNGAVPYKDFKKTLDAEYAKMKR